VAAARALKGPVTRADVADAESYAVGDYIVDLLRGEREDAAINRITARVAALTGLDPAVVRRYDGRLDTDIFLHELRAAQGRVASMYDATVSEPNPFPHRPFGWYPDPVLDALKPPVSSTMVALYAAQLNWRPKRLYELANEAAFHEWNWGNGMGRPEAVSALQAALALDPRLRVLVVHGLFDLRTPYFTSARILRALPDIGAPDRIRLEVYPGGHMFYADDASRIAFRRDAMAVFQP
jgi:carboxypeptidase C (cathepsin A)